MPTTVSRDLKARIPVLFYEHGFNIKNICGLLGVKMTLVYQTLSYARTYGVSYNPHPSTAGQKWVLSRGDLKFVVTLLNRRHSIYLNEIQKHLGSERGAFVSIAMLLCTLHRLHYSHKRASIHALERDNLLHSAFINRIADKVPNPDMLMFIDEAAHNKRMSIRTNGWSLVGKQCTQRRCFSRG